VLPGSHHFAGFRSHTLDGILVAILFLTCKRGLS
jgi:hypothetical protein